VSPNHGHIMPTCVTDKQFAQFVEWMSGIRLVSGILPRIMRVD